MISLFHLGYGFYRVDIFYEPDDFGILEAVTVGHDNTQLLASWDFEKVSFTPRFHTRGGCNSLSSKIPCFWANSKLKGHDCSTFQVTILHVCQGCPCASLFSKCFLFWSFKIYFINEMAVFKMEDEMCRDSAALCKLESQKALNVAYTTYTLHFGIYGKHTHTHTPWSM